MTIKAIQTTYAGCRFRSRLEARWAVFFDHLGIKWEYEPQGYVVGLEELTYLPDFWLPATKTWVEVKGTDEHLDLELLVAAIDYGQGLPGIVDSLGGRRGILLLGPLPKVGPGEVAVHTILQHYKGVIRGCWTFTADGTSANPGPAILGRHIDGDGEYVGSGGCGPIQVTGGVSYTDAQVLIGGGPDFGPVALAYAAARSARFEHGESPTARPATGHSRDDSRRTRAFQALGPLIDAVLNSAAADRDNHLYPVACRAFGHVDNGLFTHATARIALSQAARAAGLADGEITVTLDRAQAAARIGQVSS